MARLLLSLLLLDGLLVAADAACPSNCHGHGACQPSNTCSCFPGYTSFDCAYRTCPLGAPWIDFATADDTIRAVPRECSNRGRCNRDSGRCECDAGFSGSACERLSLCRVGCSGHGKCLSMRALAATRNDRNLLYSTTYATPWDADRIYGCVCDVGYAGVDCSLRQCPFGDDPITTGQVDEIQALSCLCDGCSGSFSLSFRGEATRPLDPTAETAVTLKAALEALSTIREVAVALDGSTSGVICDSNGVSALITFTLEHGDVPPLRIASQSLTGGTSSLSIQTGDGGSAAYGSNAATQTGTKEWLPCSGRGKCNTLTGICTCQSSFGPSDGKGNAGIIQDCGHYEDTTALSTCVGFSGSAIVCSGHGRCLGSPSYQCDCEKGFTSYDCSKPRCPTGRPWVEEAQTDNTAHLSNVECSNAGICNDAGICSCLPGFEGTACDRMSCPTVNGLTCNDRGRCRTAREMAALTPTIAYATAGFVYGTDPNAVSTWEADMVRGCYCDKLYQDRGANVRYTGYACQTTPCPSGDDPWTSSQVDTVQTVSCKAGGGYFTLSFRGETTRPISASATAIGVKYALESLITITSVSVTFSAGVASACTSAGNVMTITFYSPSGPLPALSIDATGLSGTVLTSVQVVTSGTKEDSVCNNRGRCDEATGTCICALHHASSDARGGFGVLNDCGVVDAFMTHGEL